MSYPNCKSDLLCGSERKEVEKDKIRAWYACRETSGGKNMLRKGGKNKTMKNWKMRIGALALAAAMAAVPCIGAAAAEPERQSASPAAAETGRQSTEPAAGSKTDARTDEKGLYVGLSNGTGVYEDDLIRMVEGASGSLTVEFMNRADVPASVLKKAKEQNVKLVFEIFTPGFDAAMFNSRWVFEPSYLYWEPDQEYYPLGISLDLVGNPEYHSLHPDAGSNPFSSIVRNDGVEWALYDLYSAEGCEGSAFPGFSYVEVAHWGEFDGLQQMPVYSVYSYNETGGTITNSGYGAKGDDAAVSDSIVWSTVRIYNPYQGANYAVLSDEHNFLPVEEIEEQIKDPDIAAVDIQMGSCYLDEQYVLPAETLDQLRDSGKTMSLTSPGVESQPTYSWFFDGTEITDTMDMDLHVQFYYSPYNVQDLWLPAILEDLPEDVPSILFDFTHSGPVPGGTEVSLTASTEFAQEGHLYYVNESDGTFEYAGEVSAEMENEYFCTLTVSGITHCSYYLVSSQKLTGGNVVEPEDPSTPEGQEPPEGQEKPEGQEPPEDQEKPEDQDKPQEQNEAQAQAGKIQGSAVKTGDKGAVFPAVMAAGVSIAAAAWAIRRKMVR